MRKQAMTAEGRSHQTNPIFDLGEGIGVKKMANLKDESPNNDASVTSVDMKIEAVVIPVSDVERAE